MLVKRRDAEEVVEILWEHFDTDGSGYIEMEEAKDMFEFMFMHNKHALDRHTLAELFKLIDKNGDERLSKNEVVDMLLSKL